VFAVHFQACHFQAHRAGSCPSTPPLPDARIAQLKPSPDVIAVAEEPRATVVGEAGQERLSLLNSPHALPQH
jgi:hypothetical protein